MSNIPENTITQADLSAWYVMREQLKKLKASEIRLRKKIFNAAFPEPVEGTNEYDLADGYVLKGTHTIQRIIDEDTLGALNEKLRARNINPDSLVAYKPHLAKGNYNKLTSEEQQFFDQCLIVKSGSPALAIMLPKRTAKQS